MSALKDERTPALKGAARKKKLSLHVNREIEARPVPSLERSRAGRHMIERGLYVEEIAPEGEHWYKLVTSTGKVGTVHLPDELCDEGTAENLWTLLDKKDPTTDHSHLQLVRRKS